MALLSRDEGPKAIKPPKAVDERLKRGRERMEEQALERREAIEFARGNQYLYRSEDHRYLKQQSTVTSYFPGKGKPQHRMRLTRNLIKPIIDGKISAATQRVPSYEVVPGTRDYEDIAAAHLAEKVAAGGYEAWRIRHATKKVAWYALVADIGFAFPYFDPNIGPYVEVEDEDGNLSLIGQGDIRIRTYGPNEVFWEPGMEFEESPWFATEVGRPVEVVEKEPGFLGGKLRPDASGNNVIGSEKSDQGLVMETTYFERPCHDYPEGRTLVMANGRVIFPEDAYPLRDADGQAKIGRAHV